MQIEVRSKYHALDFLVVAIQILTVICIIKGKSAWNGSLSMLFLGGVAALFYKHDKYDEKPYMYV